MTLQQIIDEVIAVRVAQLTESLGGVSLTGFWDDRGSPIMFNGHCTRVHPDLVETYPNGWSLGHDETLQEALDKAGFTLTLTRITP